MSAPPIIIMYNQTEKDGSHNRSINLNALTGDKDTSLSKSHRNYLITNYFVLLIVCWFILEQMNIFLFVFLFNEKSTFIDLQMISKVNKVIIGLASSHCWWESKFIFWSEIKSHPFVCSRLKPRDDWKFSIYGNQINKVQTIISKSINYVCISRIKTKFFKIS